MRPAGSLDAGPAGQQHVLNHPEGTCVAATPSTEGIINPPIDDLLQVVDSKYGLVIMASKRARQINAYYAQLGEGLLEYVGPLVETRVQEKPLSIALREISERLLSAELPPAES
jgi:DNA-directed RNA polymerase subunit omega